MLPLKPPTEAWAILGLAAEPTLAQINDAWRRLRSAAHPDRGGSLGAFTRLKGAHIVACAYASQPRDCALCAGTGLLPTKVRGGFVTSVTCRTCAGTGRV